MSISPQIFESILDRVRVWHSGTQIVSVLYKSRKCSATALNKLYILDLPPRLLIMGDQMGRPVAIESLLLICGTVRVDNTAINTLLILEMS